jgi:hypothetical protein
VAKPSIRRQWAFQVGYMALLALAAWLCAGADTSKAAAAECPNEAIRIAQGATRLPDCRAYERVSPQDSTGGVVGVDTLNQLLFGAVRADGNAMTYGSSSAIGDSERSAPLTFNLAHRSSTGWSSSGVLTVTEPSVPLDRSMAPTWPTPSSDMTRMLFVSGRSLGPPNPATNGGSIYLSAPEGKGPPTWLSRSTIPGPQPNQGGNPIPLGGTSDLNSGYFRYERALTDQAGDDLRTNTLGLYFFEGSTIKPAGVLPSGTVSPLGALPAGSASTVTTSGVNSATPAESSFNLPEQARNQVSADGSKLFFVSPAEGPEPKQLYVEEGGAPGRLVSHDVEGNASTAGIAELGGRPGFAYATPDGSRVLFRSETALTGDAPAAGMKTYRAEITPSAITLTYLPAIDGSVLTIDKDASTVLFGIPGNEPGTSTYGLWDEGRPSSPYTVAANLPSGATTMFEPVLSEDGDVLVFASSAEIEPGDTPLPEVNYTQVYRWTKQSETATCISCLPDGGTPARFGSRMSTMNGLPTDNPAFPTGETPNFFYQSSVVGNRKISSDGSRVFFDTSDPLDPARDVNGTRDVYMWEDGKDYLLTSGRGPIPSEVIDSSESGNDVLLVTADGLVPSDTNQTYDVYDVRVDGGFAEPNPEGCEGDACQGQGAGPREAAAPASAKLVWAGSKHESAKGKALRVAQLGRPGSKSARVRIQAPGAGRVSIAGTDVAETARGVTRGSVVIRISLSAKGKRKLSHDGHLKATVRVTFRPQSGAAIKKSIELRFAGAKGAR